MKKYENNAKDEAEFMDKFQLSTSEKEELYKDYKRILKNKKDTVLPEKPDLPNGTDQVHSLIQEARTPLDPDDEKEINEQFDQILNDHVNDDYKKLSSDAEARDRVFGKYELDKAVKKRKKELDLLTNLHALHLSKQFEQKFNDYYKDEQGQKTKDEQEFEQLQRKPTREEKGYVEPTADEVSNMVNEFQAPFQKSFEKHMSKLTPVEATVYSKPIGDNIFKVAPVTSADQIMKEGADLYQQRNKIYGSAYKKQGQVMQTLFTNGVKCDSIRDFNRLTVLSTIVSKLIRYTNDFSTPHDDSILDIMVYASMLLELDRSK